MRDGELTDDRLRDGEEKVAENVKHADGYLCEVEGIIGEFLLLESQRVH